MKATVYVDGASRGNPGPASCAVVLLVEGQPTREFGFYLGTTTNNVAEYCGFLAGLTAARRSGADEVLVMSDSELCVRQINGEYKVRSANLKILWDKVRQEMLRFRKWEVRHVPRSENEAADRLSNQLLDLVADLRDLGGGTTPLVP